MEAAILFTTVPHTLRAPEVNLLHAYMSPATMTICMAAVRRSNGSRSKTSMPFTCRLLQAHPQRLGDILLQHSGAPGG